MEWNPVSCSADGRTPTIKNHSVTLYNGQLYVFGGYDGRKNHNSLLTFDILTQEWSTIVVQGDVPPGRNGHSATLAVDKIVVIGGWLGSGPLAAQDVWILDVANPNCISWECLEIKGEPPGPCNMHSADFLENKNEVFVFRGGNGREYLNDLHALNVKTKIWRTVNPSGQPPQQRANHSSAVISHELFIFGGWNGKERLNDLYILDSETETWSAPSISGILPHPRAGMSLTALRGRLYLFGGSGSSSKCFDDLQILDRRELRWLDITTGDMETSRETNGTIKVDQPPYRSLISPNRSRGNYPRRAEERNNQRALLQNPSNPMMAMTASNPNEHERHNSIHAYGNAPGRRAGHTSTAVGKRIYIFGGSCGSDYLSDFFYLDTDPEPDIFVKDGGCMSRLEQNLHQHFDEEQFSDVTFIVEGRKVFAHRLILASTSDYFQAMFSSGFKEAHYEKSSLSVNHSTGNEMEMHDCSYSCFVEVLKHIYTGLLPEFEEAKEDVTGGAAGSSSSDANKGKGPGGAGIKFSSNSQDTNTYCILTEGGLRKACETLALSDRFMLDHLKQAMEKLLSENVNEHTWESLHDFGIQCQAFQLVSFCEHYHRNSDLDGAEAGLWEGEKGQGGGNVTTDRDQGPMKPLVDNLEELSFSGSR